MRPRCLIIVDQSLRDFNGHHYEYDLAVARAGLGLGLDVRVLAHRSFGEGASFPVPVRPWFAQGWNETGRGLTTRVAASVLSHLTPGLRQPLIRLGGALRRRVRRSDPHDIPAFPRFGEEVVAALALERIGPEDHVLIHTASNAELHALVAADRAAPVRPHLHVVLRRDAEEPAVASDPWGGMSALLRSIRDTPALVGKTHLYADTEALAAQHRALAPGLRIDCVPIPHCLPERPLGPRSEGPLRIVYLGNARTEKGFDLLPRLVSSLYDTHLRTGRARFIIQANCSMSLEEPIILRARKALATFPSAMVELIDQALDLGAFQDLLALADIVVLPYSTNLYRRRSSGILIQAATWAKPLVVPANSWLADEAPAAASTVFHDTDDLPEAVRHCVDHFERLQAEAQAASVAFRGRHNATRLIHILLDSAKAAVSFPETVPPSSSDQSG